MQVLLVVVFGIIERFRGSDFRRDLTFITGRLHRFPETRQAGLWAATSCSGVSG